MKKLMLVSMAVLTGTLVAADLVVQPGETVTIDSDGDYGAILDNGTLLFADGVKVTAQRFIVASGDVANVSCVIGKNVKLNVSGTTKFGMDRGWGDITIGACSTVSVVKVGMTVGVSNDRKPTGKTTLTLDRNAQLIGSGTDNTLIMSEGCQSWTTSGSAAQKKVLSEIVLNEGSSLQFSSVKVTGYPYGRVIFNGGEIRNNWNTGSTCMIGIAGHWQYKNVGTYLYLTSSNANDIVLNKTSHAHSFLARSGDTGYIVFEGDGDVVFTATTRDNGSGQQNKLLIESRPDDRTTDKVLFKQKGAVCFKGVACPAMKFYNKDNDLGVMTNFFPAATVLKIGKSAAPDFNGTVQTVARVECDGAVSNLSGKVVHFTVTGSETSRIEKVGSNIELTKKGTGSLTIGKLNDPTVAIDVQAGAFSVTNTGAFGTLALDASAATADFGVFAPAANTVLALTNFTAAEYPAKLPIGYTSIADRSALSQWTVTLDGTPFVAQPITAHAGSLYLGRFGLKIIVQ